MLDSIGLGAVMLAVLIDLVIDVYRRKSGGNKREAANPPRPATSLRDRRLVVRAAGGW